MGTVVDDLITRVFDEVRSLDEGELADYIPELAAVAPDSFGICIATVDGYVYEIGDSRIPFTIQSISKPFVYGLALADRGKAAVLERIGVEPTGAPKMLESLRAGKVVQLSHVTTAAGTPWAATKPT